MKEINEEELKLILEVGEESRNLEFKSAFKWNAKKYIWLREKVIQTILAMTNTKNGGRIIIGVKENSDKSREITGLNKIQIKSFQNFDEIKEAIDKYASETIVFEVVRGTYKKSVEGKLQKKQLIIFNINEFEEFPVLCKKNSLKRKKNRFLLEEGIIYSRLKKGKAQTSRITDMELKEIIRMAADKEKSMLQERGWEKKSKVSIDKKYAEQNKDLE